MRETAALAAATAAAPYGDEGFDQPRLTDAYLHPVSEGESQDLGTSVTMSIQPDLVKSKIIFFFNSKNISTIWGRPHHQTQLSSILGSTCVLVEDGVAANSHISTVVDTQSSFNCSVQLFFKLSNVKLTPEFSAV